MMRRPLVVGGLLLLAGWLRAVVAAEPSDFPQRLPPTFQQVALAAPQQGRLPVPIPSPAAENPAAGPLSPETSGVMVSGEEGTRGLELGSPDWPFTMRIGSWGHFRHSYLDSHGPNPGLNELEFERLRLVFDGDVYSSDFRYFLQLDADSDAAEVVDMLDYYVTYDLGHDLWQLDPGRIALRAGKWKIPFARSRFEAGNRLQFADRSMAGVFFDFQRSIGIGLLGRLGGSGSPVEWFLTITNGINTGNFRTGRTGDLSQNLAVAGRLTWLLAGDLGSDGEPDLDYRRIPAWRLGTGFAYSREDRNDGLAEFSLARVVDSGETLASVLPATVTAYDYCMFALDSQLKYHGLSLIAEYLFRYLSGFSGAPVPDLFDHGLILQTGYFVVPHKLEIMARWSRIAGNSGTLGATYQSADEIAAGIAWYIHGHNLKIVFDATHVNGAPISDPALNILPGDDGWLYRTQFQFMF